MASQNTAKFLFRTSDDNRIRLEHHAKRLGATMNSLVREATSAYLDLLDIKEADSKRNRLSGRGRGLAHVPDHITPQGLGPTRAEAKKAPPQPPPPSPFAALASPPYTVPDKVKKAFRGWAEFLEESDGLVENERRARKIVDDLKTRVEEKDVQPCYEAFVDFCTERKDAKPQPMIAIGDVPLVGDV